MSKNADEGPNAGLGKSSSAMSSMTRKLRASTWSDSELEELYDIKKMDASTALKTMHLLQVMKAIRHCNKAKTLEDAISVVVQNTCQILGCDRATLFIVDEIREDLVIKQAVDIEDIRIPLDTSSIAGSVYHSGVKLNIPDAYCDDRFNKSIDEASGYKTKSILCTPIWDANYEPVAVLQAVNKIGPDPSASSSSTPSLGARLFKRKHAKQQQSKNSSGSNNKNNNNDNNSNSNDNNNGGSSDNNYGKDNKNFIPFNTEDEVLMDHLSLQLGVIIRNQMLNEESQRRHAQVLSLLDIVKSLHSGMGVNSLMFTITERSPSLVDADRCTLYVVDRKHDELWSLQGAIEIRVPIDKGLAGASATTGKVINIEDAHKDDRFNTEYDIKTGFRTKSVLVMPIKDRPQDGREASVIGVLQVINKLHGPRFTEEDEDLLGSFLDIIGSLLMESQLFATSLPRPTEFGAAADITAGGPVKRTNSASGFPDMIAEEEEGEGEDSLTNLKPDNDNSGPALAEEEPPSFP